MALFGLIGKNIDYSFSRNYFSKKFETNHLPHQYVNFDLSKIELLEDQVLSLKNLKGFNVTIPYKQEIIPFLDLLSKKAKNIGAVNTVKITKKGMLKGYNTDYYGFTHTLKAFQFKNKNALILGTGGASKAIVYALKKQNFNCTLVSRNKQKSTIIYKDISKDLINNCDLIVNCTPLGTYPDIDKAPPLPYNFLNKNHLLYDLIYNPEKTKFLNLGEINGAQIINGYNMLVAQAEKSWEIWNKK